MAGSVDERIRLRLTRVGPGPSTMFADACALMSKPEGLGSTSHLVAHLLREVLSSLEQVLYAVSGPGAIEPAGQEGFGDGQQQAIQGRDSHATKVRAILPMLGVDATSDIGTAWLELAQNKGLSAWAHRKALDAPRPVGDEFRAAWDSALALLDALLERFEAKFLAWRRTLDGLLSKPHPGRRQVTALRNDIPNNTQNLAYFFTRAGPEWLEPLIRGNFFSVAPDTDVDPGGTSWRYPTWPPVNYLTRIAGTPGMESLVTQALEQIPPTDNTFIWMGVYQAALALPPRAAARLLPYLAQAFSVRALLAVPDLAGDLVASLATQGFGAESLPLCRQALSLSADSASSHGYRSAVGVLDKHEFKSFLEKVNLPLSDSAGIAWVGLLSDLLDLAVSIESADNNSEDYSKTWRRTIGHDEEWPDIKGALVSALRDASIRISSTSRGSASELVTIFEGYRWPIFRRLALHLLATAASDTPIEFVEARVTEKGRWDREDHEYRVLLHEFFPKCTAVGRQVILDRIEAGPDRALLRARLEEWLGHAPTETEIRRAVNEWVLGRFVPIKDHLDHAWAARYESIVQELGIKPPLWNPSAGPREFVIEHPKSPKTAAELGAMRVSELAAWLRTWKAPETTFGSLESALANELSLAVMSNPLAFAADAREFADVPPIYVTRVLEALVGPKFDSAIPLEPVLDLCAAVAATACTEQERHWRYARGAVASLVIRLLQRQVRPSSSLRSQILRIVEELARDPDPTPEREDAGERPYELGLSSVRGEAMRAAILFALWLAQMEEHGPGAAQAAAPEARNLIARHLDVECEPSGAVRSVIAAHLRLITVVELEWGRAVAAALFEPSLPRSLRRRVDRVHRTRTGRPTHVAGHGRRVPCPCRPTGRGREFRANEGGCRARAPPCDPVRAGRARAGGARLRLLQQG